jgi:hypothetical protein
MKQNLLIILVIGFLVAVLAALNAATYVQKEKVPDTEFAPNRSTYNSGSTGTQAFYSLLSETGRNVSRWQSSFETIASDLKDRPAVMVMIGPLRGSLTDAENTQLMKWVSAGGTLIIIDREPSPDLAMTTANWQLAVSPVVSAELFGVDAADQTQMTASTPAVKPVLPSNFSQGVNAIQPSRFASSVELKRFETYARATVQGTGSSSGSEGFSSSSPSPTPYDFYSAGPPPPAARQDEAPETSSDAVEESDDNDYVSFEAPVVHVGNAGKNLLVEAPFADGRVIILSDPYIVSNAGINLVDNARLAVNLVTARGGRIAFDEYHHGYGANTNRLFQYFEGTPVIAIFLQCGLLVALVFLSQSRRFARPVPEREPSRLSKLEYVSAMAELQQRTRAYDLAIENVYADFRRRVCSLVGLDNTMATRSEIAARVAERTGGRAREIEELLYECEDIIRGEPVGRKETVALVERIRKLEQTLGLQRSVRKGV